jgi:hypothetical protein
MSEDVHNSDNSDQEIRELAQALWELMQTSSFEIVQCDTETDQEQLERLWRLPVSTRDR